MCFLAAMADFSRLTICQNAENTTLTVADPDRGWVMSLLSSCLGVV